MYPTDDLIYFTQTVEFLFLKSSQLGSLPIQQSELHKGKDGAMVFEVFSRFSLRLRDPGINPRKEVCWSLQIQDPLTY